MFFQFQKRVEGTRDPDTEGRWFERKVIRKATDQIKDSLRYLTEHGEIMLTNGRGRQITVRGSDFGDLKKVIVYLADTHLPQDCRNRLYHVSSTAGFIHVTAAHDYLGVLEKLRVPDDVRLYLEYRAQVLPRLRQLGVVVEEPDIMVAFLKDRDLPASGSRAELSDFVQDLGEFDLSDIIRGIESHIVNPTGGTEYYRILEEFARVPRSVWREFKTRMVMALDASKNRRFQQPFRFAFPSTDVCFMIASMDPSWPSTDEDGHRMRSGAVSMFSELAKYSLRTQKCVGVLVSMAGEQFQLDWCLLDGPWTENPVLEAMLEEHAALFRPVSDVRLDSFFFRGDGH